jgi:hypothetical protein
MSLTEKERHVAEGILYYLEIGSSWCFITKQYHTSDRRELERLVALYKEEQQNVRNKMVGSGVSIPAKESS